jgi:protein SCO1/2
MIRDTGRGIRDEIRVGTSPLERGDACVRVLRRALIFYLLRPWSNAVPRPASRVPLLLALFLGLAAAAPAQDTQNLRDLIGIDQKLNAQVPPGLSFKDETGKDVRLADYFGRRPILLSLVFFNCTGACEQELEHLSIALKGLLKADAGKDFEVLTVSIHPKETPELASQTKQVYIDMYGRPQDAGGWHFLTGSLENIRGLTKAVGFRFLYDPETDRITHPVGIMILTPDGRVSRYFYGLEYPPKLLLTALQDAGRGRVGEKAEEFFLGCVHYDPRSHKYSLVIWQTVRVLGLLTTLVVAGSIFAMSKKHNPRIKEGTPA